MNRLWVRLSLLISLVLFSMFFLQFLQIMWSSPPAGLPAGEGGPLEAPKSEIASRLLEFMGFSLVVGAVGGLGIGRLVSAPITGLSKAAQRVGQGELAVRVPVRGSREMKDLAEAFNKMAGDLQQAQAQRNNLLADVSHELRTPLAVLEGNLRAVLDHVYVLDEAEVANLYSQTRHLVRLVNDLRELTLAESGELAMERQPILLKPLVEEVVSAIEPLAAEQRITLLNQVPDLPEVLADSMRLRQVLFNLISNALRHTPTGGQITLSGSSGPAQVMISIRDSGEGMLPEQLSAVFDRFYRGDKSRSRDTGGTGLGLSIVKAIVEAHGGRVEARSAGPGQGSEFLVWLPAENR